MASPDSWRSREFYVGLFVAGGLALLVFFVFSVGSIPRLVHDTRTVTVEFGYIGGLRAGQPVHYAGHPVGSVESVRVDPGPPPRLLATLRLPGRLPVPENTTVTIGSTGLIGNRVVEILPPADPADPLGAGEVLRGRDPVNMSRLLGRVREWTAGDTGARLRELLENAHAVSEQLADVGRTLRSVTTSRDTDLQRLIANLATSSGRLPPLLDRIDTTTRSLARLADGLGDLTTRHDTQLRDTIRNLHAASETLRGLTRDRRGELDRLITNLSAGSERLSGLLARADSAARSLDDLARRLDAIGGENREELRGTIRNLNRTSKHLRGFAEEVEEHPSILFWGR